MIQRPGDYERSPRASNRDATADRTQREAHGLPGTGAAWAAAAGPGYDCDATLRSYSPPAHAA